MVPAKSAIKTWGSGAPCSLTLAPTPSPPLEWILKPKGQPEDGLGVEGGRAKWSKLKRDADFAADHPSRKDVRRTHGMRGLRGEDRATHSKTEHTHCGQPCMCVPGGCPGPLRGP